MAGEDMQAEDHALLAALHEGMFEESLWTNFLALLRRRVGADYVSLIFRRRDTPIHQIVELFDGKTLAANLRRQYQEEIYRHDPVPYHDLVPGRVYELFEMLDPNEPGHASYINNILAPSGANFVRIVRAVEPGGYNGWLTLCRIKSDFSDEAIALVKELAPHLAIALRCFASMENSRIRQNMYADAVNRLNFGCLTLDAEGAVIDLDAYAERLLRESSALRQNPQGRLLLSSSRADKLLRGALADFVANPGERPRAVHLSDEPYLDMLLMPMRQRPVAGPVTPVLVAYVHGDEHSNADRWDQMMELFGLSHTEARLALSLSRGRTITEAAKEIGITIETARNYSKRIYSKTGTRRQAELVRLILASVLALA